MLDAADAITLLPRATSCRITSTTAVVLPVPGRGGCSGCGCCRGCGSCEAAGGGFWREGGWAGTRRC
jgi:hypothetical protein